MGKGSLGKFGRNEETAGSEGSRDAGARKELSRSHLFFATRYIPSIAPRKHFSEMFQACQVVNLNLVEQSETSTQAAGLYCITRAEDLEKWTQFQRGYGDRGLASCNF